MKDKNTTNFDATIVTSQTNTKASAQGGYKKTNIVNNMQLLFDKGSKDGGRKSIEKLEDRIVVIKAKSAAQTIVSETSPDTEQIKGRTN